MRIYLYTAVSIMDFFHHEGARRFRPIMYSQCGLCSKYDLCARPAFRLRCRLHRHPAKRRNRPKLHEAVNQISSTKSEIHLRFATPRQVRNPKSPIAEPVKLAPRQKRAWTYTSLREGRQIRINKSINPKGKRISPLELK